ncbi:hypothetical protein ACQ4PT_044027 [Festuca glaucescens]
MDSLSAKRRPRRDRLSDLPDDLLGHVLSFLPTEEAGRAAVLSRRWRRVIADVHTISFQEGLLDRVTAALLARRRCSGGETRLRCFRVALGPYMSSDSSTLHHWLSYALDYGVQELHLVTRRQGSYDIYCCITGCRRVDDIKLGYAHGGYVYSAEADKDSESNTFDEDWEDDDPIDLPAKKLFSCATLRALHLVSCSLRGLPSTIDLPSLETLALIDISPLCSSGEDIQRLVSSCPRLGCLALEDCEITDITVAPEARCLRSFAMRCCHEVRSVTIDASETLRSFDYRGEAPVEPCFMFVGGGALTAIASAKINVCSTGIWPNGEIHFGRLKEELLLPFVSAAHLHLGWVDRPDALAGGDDFFAEFPLFNNLTRLDLGSRLMDPRAVAAVTGILRQTPNLTVLSLQIGKHDSSGTTEWGTVDLYQRSFAVDVPDVPAGAGQGGERGAVRGGQRAEDAAQVLAPRRAGAPVGL